jgi:hypothetical protein
MFAFPVLKKSSAFGLAEITLQELGWGLGQVDDD